MATAKFNAFVAAGADNKLQVDGKLSDVRRRRARTICDAVRVAAGGLRGARA
jgi:hypothetical protein